MGRGQRSSHAEGCRMRTRSVAWPMQGSRWRRIARSPRAARGRHGEPCTTVKSDGMDPQKQLDFITHQMVIEALNSRPSPGWARRRTEDPLALNAGRALGGQYRSSRRLLQHRHQRVDRHHLFDPASRGASSLASAGPQPACGRLHHIRSPNRAGADRWRRHAHFLAASRRGGVPAREAERPDPGGDARIRRQRLEFPLLGRCDQGLCRSIARSARTARARPISTRAGSPRWWPKRSAF